MRIKIPDAIQIAGRSYEIEIVDRIINENLDGQIKYTDGKIILSRNNNYGKASKDYFNHVFLHEIIHGVLNSMSSDKQDDEGFIDMFSNLLLQVIKQL